jgi:hypothetical protein
MARTLAPEQPGEHAWGEQPASEAELDEVVEHGLVPTGSRHPGFDHRPVPGQPGHDRRVAQVPAELAPQRSAVGTTGVVRRRPLDRRPAGQPPTENGVE